MRVLIFVSLLSLTLGVRIIGGHNITIDQVPYQVAVEYREAQLCAGVIIAPKFVLATAECLIEAAEELLKIRAGTTTLEEGGQLLPVKKYYNHPNYSTEHRNYDVAVIELETNIEFGFSAAQIALPTRTTWWSPGTNGTISGWGVLSYGSREKSSVLQGATVQIVERAFCEEAYKTLLKDGMFCAGVLEGGIGQCTYDFGGALQIDGVLAGIFSFGWGCGDGARPDIYTNISLALDFIEDVTGL